MAQLGTILDGEKSAAVLADDVDGGWRERFGAANRHVVVVKTVVATKTLFGRAFSTFSE